MKAFLLAAGEGTRLRPFTSTTPKCLLPIGGIPLLEIWYRHLERSGVTDVLINVHHFADHVGDFIRQLQTTIKTRVAFEPKLLGSAGTIRENRDFVRGDDFFLIIYTDGLTTMPLEPLLRIQQKHHPVLTMGLFHTDIPKESGIVTLDPEGLILDFTEKPSNPIGDLSNTGIMAASPRLFDFIPKTNFCDLSYTVIPRLIGKMRGVVTDHFFIDIGNLANYKAAQRKWKSIKRLMGY